MALADRLYSGIMTGAEGIAQGMRHASALRENQFWQQHAEAKRESNLAEERQYQRQLHNESLVEQDARAKKIRTEANRDFFRRTTLAETDAALKTLDELATSGEGGYFADPKKTRSELEARKLQIMSDNYDPEDFDAVTPSFHEGIAKYRTSQAALVRTGRELEENYKRAQTAKLVADADENKGKSYGYLDGQLFEVEDLKDKLAAVKAKVVAEKNQYGINSGKLIADPSIAAQIAAISDAIYQAGPYDVVASRTSARKIAKEQVPALVPYNPGEANPPLNHPLQRFLPRNVAAAPPPMTSRPPLVASQGLPGGMTPPIPPDMNTPLVFEVNGKRYISQVRER